MDLVNFPPCDMQVVLETFLLESNPDNMDQRKSHEQLSPCCFMWIKVERLVFRGWLGTSLPFLLVPLCSQGACVTLSHSTAQKQHWISSKAMIKSDAGGKYAQLASNDCALTKFQALFSLYKDTIIIRVPHT